MNNFTVLLVDDVEENIHSLKLIIEQNFNINIHSALNAQDAIKILMDNHIDLILSDVQMPDVDGFQMAEYIKGIEQLKDIPIIFITGIYDKDEYKKQGYELGAVEYISKPIDDVLLCSKLKVYIEMIENKKTQEEELEKSNELFIHQSKMATMGEMIGVIAHQLKQPLNALSLYCSDVKEAHEYNEINDKFVEEFSANTKVQIEFMNQTIHDFMEFFKPNKEKVQFSFKDCMDKTQSLLLNQLESNNIELTTHISNETVLGVQTELQQVLLNLITNAKEAFIERDIENRQINITSMKKDKYTIILVEDNAGGIAQENIEKIFDPYFTTKEHGTGTGLYMVKMVIQTSFGGDLKIQSTNNGTKFIIAVPS